MNQERGVHVVAGAVGDDNSDRAAGREPLRDVKHPGNAFTRRHGDGDINGSHALTTPYRRSKHFTIFEEEVKPSADDQSRRSLSS
jgi:hypothetical protein